MDLIFSDVHGNLAAFEAVMKDAERHKAERVICLGDTVGYGPDPVECLRRVRNYCDVVLMGNHEYAVVHGADGFNPIAEEAIEWTRVQLVKHMGEEVIDYLDGLKSAYIEEEALFVHGSIKDPLMDYVREADSYASFRKLVDTIRQDFQGFNVCFTGHNHRAFLGTDEGFIYPHEVVHRFNITDSKLYACVGSVGQPRDGDPRACYVTFDGEWIDYHRVEYDISRTAKRIAEQGLHPFLAERLFAGQ
ncbi:MAG: metallophosphoesterase family protein [Planctomycetes bacterium]|nr:metallophosphoesterase family protein [Planctomycetota bacterium]